jgi:purine-nucleoside phosphorylase
MSDSVSTAVAQAADAVAGRASLDPRTVLVLGSGLGPLADEVREPASIPYSEIPGFPVSTAPGHAGRLVIGRLEGEPVAVMAGRAHLYEGYSPEKVVFPIRTLWRLGARILIVTNAAGGVNPVYRPGTFMIIADHINLTGRNPLVGPADSGLGARFPDMTEAYDPALRALAHRASLAAQVSVAEGVYLGLLGPSYETPAEIRMARALGADAVGMSTVMEVIAAVHSGMRVLGISLISNMAAGMLPQKLTEEEVIDTANAVREPFARLLREILRSLAASS